MLVSAKRAVAVFVSSAIVSIPVAFSAQTLPPEKGSVEGNTYTNHALGLIFTPSANLKLGPPEMLGTPGTVPLVVTVTAWGPIGWFRPRQGTVFSVEGLAYYPDNQRTPEAYMRKVIAANKKEGFDLVEGPADGQIGRYRFARSDFRKAGVREAVLVTTHNGYALVFIFTGGDDTELSKLIASTKLEFTR